MYHRITSVENLLCAWKEFVSGKKQRRDVQEFQLRLMENIFSLNRDLFSKHYQHGSYQAFNISDPKPRNIHKATVRDRLLHHAVHRVLSPYFDKKFIHDSYSCRTNRGTHTAAARFRRFFGKESRNNTRVVWVLKCDIKKFFASINHEVLTHILKSHRLDTDTIQLLSLIIASFHSGKDGQGLPLGNLTSQLLVNVYMDKFDQHVKHVLRVKYYIRYADDFVILSHDRRFLYNLLSDISLFLTDTLKLSLHPDKVFIKTFNSGVDFLGWVHFPAHRVLRTVTKRRMLKRLKENSTKETLASYRGLLEHGNTWKLSQVLE